MQNPVATKRLAAVRVDRRRVGADEPQALRGEKLGAVFGQEDELVSTLRRLPGSVNAASDQDKVLSTSR
jgi:hypothetical protein